MTVFSMVASQAALIAALLYYFGRVRTAALCGWFGIDAGTLGLSTTDYVVSSLSTAIPPVVLCALTVLVLLTGARHVDAAIDRIRDRPEWYRATAIGTTFVIAAAAAVVLNGISWLSTAHYSRGYPLPVAILVLTAAVLVARRLFRQGDSAPSITDRLWSLTLGAFVLAGVLWLTSLYAAHDGERAANEKADTLRSPTSTDFILLSEKRLTITGPEIQFDELASEGRYRYQYSGLRLLFRTSRDYAIVSAYWKKGRDPVTVIPIDGTIRFDLVPH
ncbi:hypothetical protein AB0K11_24120 [Mycobacterium sp. NPDC050551]|uniref:hypothetical protein n=1 Tax=Mycobacterium sp. NPDC050551 TaxID=3155407 RepID=UPI0034424431